MTETELESGAYEIVARYDLTCSMLAALVEDQQRLRDDQLTGQAYVVASAVLVRSMSEFLSSRGTHMDDRRAKDFVANPPGWNIKPFDSWVNKAIAHPTRTVLPFVPIYPGLIHSLVGAMSKFVKQLEATHPNRAKWFYEAQKRWQGHPICQRRPLSSDTDMVRGTPNRLPQFAWHPTDTSPR